MAKYGVTFDFLLTRLSDKDGAITGGTVNFFEPSTINPKLVYEDAALTIPKTSPLSLDANGTLKIYGSGLYDVQILDTDNVVRYYFTDIRLQTNDFVDGAIIVGDIDLTGDIIQIGNIDMTGDIDLNGNLTVDDNIHITNGAMGIGTTDIGSNKLKVVGSIESTTNVIAPTVTATTGNVTTLNTTTANITTLNALNIIPYGSAVCAYFTGNRSITSGLTLLTFDTGEYYDNLNAHSTSINPSRITIPANVTFAQFYYKIDCSISIFGSSFSLGLYVNGTLSTVLKSFETTGSYSGIYTMIHDLKQAVIAGQYWEIKVLSSGSSGTVSNGYFGAWLYQS